MVQKEVADMLRGRILVGHALHNDLKVLLPPAATRMPSCWLAVCSARHGRALSVFLNLCLCWESSSDSVRDRLASSCCIPGAVLGILCERDLL